MAISLEYVMSGSTGAKCFNKEFIEHPELLAIIQHYFSKINRKEHGYSILYNALTNSVAEMRKLNDCYRSSLHSIHADSGGLQMITLGLTNDADTKLKIYDRQAKYCDVAMSFDEIPIKTTVERAVMGVTSLRRFDRENLKEYAVKSAENLIEQIDYFDKEGTKRANPLAIIHGNDVDTFIDFANYMFDAIPTDYYDKIGGLSVSGQSIGEGIIESVERAFASCILPHNYKNTMHLLGVGSMTRILPYLAFAVNGLLPDGFHMSYDSTTHSGGLVRREYIDKNMARIKPGKNFNGKWEHIYRDAVKLFPEMLEHVPNAATMFNCLELDGEGREGKRVEFLHSNFAFLCGAIENFKRCIDDAMVNSEQLVQVAARHKMGRIIANLETIRDKQDFMAWKRDYGKHYSTDRIQDVETSATLDAFFA